ncbi:MAG: hypothetical protein J0G29_02245 [Alphaproteobacteria bacterium]|nr:hypothetical protein [Alphaproteobacteria bacterium]OJV45678.1 MAG: hypothetical protein BGO28_02330 [Alphaproteobacteria bacterium 43-37]
MVRFFVDNSHDPSIPLHAYPSSDIQKICSDLPWIHVDTMAWNLKSTPGKPEGGKASSLISLLDFITTKFAG